MQRLLRKFETAKDLVPAPAAARNAGKPTRYGVIYFGSTGAGDGRGARTCSRRSGLHARRAAHARLPVPLERRPSFIADHDLVFVVEQNRDAQLRTLLVNECGIDPSRLVPVLHYDGTPITARFIARAIARRSSPRSKVDAACARCVAMTYLAKPKFHHPDAAEERARLHPPRLRGHDLDAVRRLRPRFDLSARSSRPASSSTSQPHRVAKLSGIGCSSKTPTYFLGNSHGFNRVHGRMPSVLTGANLANRDLIYLGVSGDGDSRLDRPRPVRPRACAAA